LRKHYSPTVTEVLHEKEQEHERLKDDLDRARAEQINPSSEEWKKLPSLASALEQADDPDDTRIRLRAVFNHTIDKIHVLAVTSKAERLIAVQVDFAKGSKAEGPSRHYTIRCRSSYPNSPGFWQVLSNPEYYEQEEVDGELLDRTGEVKARTVRHY